MQIIDIYMVEPEDSDPFDDFFADEFDSFEDEFKHVNDAVIGFNAKTVTILDGALIKSTDESNIFEIKVGDKIIGKIGIYLDEDD